MSPAELQILQTLDAMVTRVSVGQRIGLIADRVVDQLARDSAASMAWEPIPLSSFGDVLPSGIQSCWVFVLRAGARTGAERHPNSRQRMTSIRGTGDCQIGGEGHWQSHVLVSDRNEELKKRWISIPGNTWHQAVVPDRHWVVVSFHTVPAEELIEERPDSITENSTRQRRYVSVSDDVAIGTRSWQ